MYIPSLNLAHLGLPLGLPARNVVVVGVRVRRLPGAP